MIYELKDILRLLDRFVGHYPIYLYLLDRENTVVWFNRYLADRLPEIYTGQKLPCCHVLGSAEDFCPKCADHAVSYPAQLEKNLIKAPIGPDGETFYLEFFNFPIIGPDREVQGVLRVGIDITENEKIQEKLRDKEKLFKAMIHASTDAVIFLDQDDRIMSWNKGAEDIFGYTADEIVGQPLHKLVPEELLQLGELNYLREELVNNGSVKKYETQRRHKNGRHIYVDISRSQVHDEQGNFVGTSEIVKDIDSRKELEFELLRTIMELSKLNELTEILHRTYEESEILRIILIAITAGEGLRFNRALILLVDKREKLLKGHLAIGPSDKETANRIWTELNQDYYYLKDIIQIYTIDVDGIDKKVNEIVRQIVVPLEQSDHILMWSLNKRRSFQVKNGKLLGVGECSFAIGEQDMRDILDSNTFVIAPILSKKETLGVIIADNRINGREITTEDIEGLKLFASQAGAAIENARLYRKLEDRVQELQEAYRKLAVNQEKLLRAERLATIGEMSAKVAHEIRNPLVSIGGFARLIEKRLIAEDSPLLKYAGIIRDQVDNLEHILNNLLGAANPPQPHKSLLNINDVIHHVTKVMENALEQRHIRLILDLQVSEYPIAGDERLLYQMLLNLMKNAIEALDARPTRKEIRIVSRVDEDWLELNISDNGSGIEKSLLEKIFQSFFTTKSSGTGLGLSIVRQIVESHQGTIEVNTRAEVGTTFCIRLPLVKQEKTVAED